MSCIIYSTAQKHLQKHEVKIACPKKLKVDLPLHIQIPYQSSHNVTIDRKGQKSRFAWSLPEFNKTTIYLILHFFA